MHVTLHLPRHLDDEIVSRRAADLGLIAPRLSRYFRGPRKGNGLLLGFACVEAGALEEGVRRLATVLADGS